MELLLGKALGCVQRQFLTLKFPGWMSGGAPWLATDSFRLEPLAVTGFGDELSQIPCCALLTATYPKAVVCSSVVTACSLIYTQVIGGHHGWRLLLSYSDIFVCHACSCLFKSWWEGQCLMRDGLHCRKCWGQCDPSLLRNR